MVKLNLNKENTLSKAGVADTRFTDHSGKIQQGYQLGSLTEGLVAYYPMEKGQGEVLLDGATGNHGQINGATWNDSGQVGSDALSFDGTDDYVNLGQQIEVENVRTLSCWAKKTSADTAEDIIQFDSGRISISYETQASDGFEINIYDGSSYGVITSGVTTQNTWIHLLLTYDGSTAEFYVDGASQGTVSTGLQTNNESDDAIGSDPTNTSLSFQGQIDDVRIYDRALSQPEIKALYNLTSPSGYKVRERDVPSARPDVPPSDADPSAVARYKFNGDVTDSWGKNDGTDNTSAGYVTGVFGKAKSFDGSDDYVSVSDDGSLNLKEGHGLSCWVNADDLRNDWRGILTKASSYEIIVGSTDGSVRFQVYDGSSFYTTKDIAIDTGNWYHLIHTFDGSTLRAYVNGSLKDEVTGAACQNNTEPFNIGYNSRNTAYFDGSIDDVRIYNRALTPVEVEQLYNKGAYRIKRGRI